MRKTAIRFFVIGFVALGTALVLIGQTNSSDIKQTQPYIGLRYTTVYPFGARVESVRRNSPATDAGLQYGDVVLAVDDDYLTDGNLYRAIASYNPQDEIELTIKRDGTKHRVNITLAEVPNNQTDQNLAVNQLDALRGGLHVPQVIFDSEKRQWRLEAVQSDTVLYEAGLRTDDVITSINDHRITSNAVASLRAELLFIDTAVLVIERNGVLFDHTVPANLAELLLLSIGD